MSVKSVLENYATKNRLSARVLEKNHKDCRVPVQHAVSPSYLKMRVLIEAKSRREETTYAAAPARLSNGFATVVPDNKIRNSTMNTVIIPSRCTDP